MFGFRPVGGTTRRGRFRAPVVLVAWSAIPTAPRPSKQWAGEVDAPGEGGTASPRSECCFRVTESVWQTVARDACLGRQRGAKADDALTPASPGRKRASAEP